MGVGAGGSLRAVLHAGGVYLGCLPPPEPLLFEYTNRNEYSLVYSKRVRNVNHSIYPRMGYALHSAAEGGGGSDSEDEKRGG